MEAQMARDFPDRLLEYRARAEFAKVRQEAWKNNVRTAQKKGVAPPLPPEEIDDPEPMAPRLAESDITIEKVATVLAGAAPKGLLMHRDELAGFLLGMNVYNSAARQFWLEAYGGRPYRVDRMKHAHPIKVPYLAVAWHGGVQPARLAQVMREADDGLLARFCWWWPQPVPFRLGTAVPNIDFAIAAFDRLRLLEMAPPAEAGLPATPLFVPLHHEARGHLERFGHEMQDRKDTAGGLLTSTLGKARGLALRISLNLEFLWWAAMDGASPPPTEISQKAFLAAAALVGDYLIPMAERVYGDAATSARTRNAATLARWITKERPGEVHVRHLQRVVRLPGLGEAAAIHEACEVLIEAAWLLTPPASTAAGRPRAAYTVRPELWEALR
jgi:hypothetical protein